MKIHISAPFLLFIFFMLSSCAISSKNYYKPDGPGSLHCKHPSGWAGPLDIIRYKMPGNSTVELNFGSYYDIWSPELRIRFNVSDGYKLKIKSPKIEIFSAAFESPLIVTAKNSWGKDLIKEKIIDWEVSDDLIGGEGCYYEIVIEFLDIKIPEAEEFVVKFPEYSLNGQKFQIPTTTFKRAKGTYLLPMAGAF